jgi:hypothetical protein
LIKGLNFDQNLEKIQHFVNLKGRVHVACPFRLFQYLMIFFKKKMALFSVLAFMWIDE